MGYSMRGNSTLEHLTYGVHHRGVQLVDIVEDTSDKYVIKDRSHGARLINLWTVSCGQLMDPQDVQKYSHNMGTRANNIEK